MAIDIDNERIRRIARKLANHSGLAPDYPVNITNGFSVPQWVFFMSEAQKIWLTHIATNDLEYDGSKLK